MTEDDSPAEIRRKVCTRLENLARSLPADLRVAVMAAFAISPDARLPLYQDRVSWAARKLNRNPRTARRRIDDGIHHLAQLAAVSDPAPAARPPSWRIAELRAAMALDRDRPEVIQYRRIVAGTDGQTEFDLAVTAPSPSGVEVDLFHGGTLVDRGRAASDRFGFTLVLPRPLARGEAHDFALRLRLPDDTPMRPHLACVLTYPCDLLDLRVRFHRDRLPGTVRLLRKAFQRDIDDVVPPAEEVSVDHAGDCQVRFRDVTAGMAYGLRWDRH
ncbi:hypothetical protein BLA60_09085 [Actinophytocola xinjiangensis]|uniref:Uncharacterized protein n=1 Tax=Actinophytocola xinjiangensis TaxID=485602 RepID=A0A7Z0WQF9_9PSEU|nr:hypothetical protein BLA60_09085 [Actinophytocola xinjiangensis]